MFLKTWAAELWGHSKIDIFGLRTFTETIDSSKVNAASFVDFNMVFDIVDHQMFLAKIHHYEINDLKCDWMSSNMHGLYETEANRNGSSTGFLPWTFPGFIMYLGR